MSEGAAGNVNIVLSVNKANYTQAMAEAQRQLDTFAGKAKTMGHAGVTNVQAVSASLRSLHGGFEQNLRSMERWVAQSQTATNIAKVMFPIVGAATFGFMIAELGMKLTAFVEKARQMPQVIQNGFNALNLTQKSSIDELTLSTDKIQSALDKMNHAPMDSLRAAFDQQKVSADKLAESIVAANEKLQDLLSKNNVSALGSLLGMWGTVSTRGRETVTKKFSQQIDDASYDYANTDPGTPEHDAARKRLTDLQGRQIAEAQSDLKRQQASTKPIGGIAAGILNAISPTLATAVGNGNPDNTSVIEDDKGIIRTTQNSQKRQSAQEKNDAAQAAKVKADAAKAAAEEAKSAERARLEAMVANLEAMKLQDNLSVKQVFNYWALMKSEFASGSAAYNAIVAKQAEVAVEGAKAAHAVFSRAIQKIKDGREEDAKTGGELLSSSSRFMTDRARGRDQDYLDVNTDAIDKAHNRAREQEASIMDRVGISLTRYAAAQQLANVHTQEFVTIQTSLQSILDERIAAEKENPTQENKRATQKASDDLADANSLRGIQVSEDARNMNPVYGTAAFGAKSALEDFVNASRDAATQMRDITNTALSGVNRQLVMALSGQRTNFGSMGADLFRNIAGVGLQKAEGDILSSFGFGGAAKLGTRSNPMYTISADARAVSASIGGFFGKVLGGGSGKSGSSGSSLTDDDSDGSGDSLPFQSALKDVIPFLAVGGPLSANTLAMVGERGPELFVPGVSGSIVPNHKLSSIGSAGDSHQWFIDARGATDPAQVHKQIMDAAPHIAAAAVKATREDARRRPSSHR